MPKPYTERKMNSLIKAHIREVVAHVPKKECGKHVVDLSTIVIEECLMLR